MSELIDPEDLIGFEQAAKLLGVSNYHLLKDELLKLQIGGKPFIDKRTVEKLKETKELKQRANDMIEELRAANKRYRKEHYGEE